MKFAIVLLLSVVVATTDADKPADGAKKEDAKAGDAKADATADPCAGKTDSQELADCKAAEAKKKEEADGKKAKKGGICTKTADCGDTECCASYTSIDMGCKDDAECTKKED